MGKKKCVESGSKNLGVRFNTGEESRNGKQESSYKYGTLRTSKKSRFKGAWVSANKILKRIPYKKLKCQPVANASASANPKKHAIFQTRLQLRHSVEEEEKLGAAERFTGSYWKAHDGQDSEIDLEDRESTNETYAVIRNCTVDVEHHVAPLLRPLFFEVPQTEEKEYVAREWVFSSIDASLCEANSSRGFILHGGPGTGKTTLALQLVEHSYFGRKHSRNVLDGNNRCSYQGAMLEKLASNIVAYHFFQVDNKTTCLVSEFVHSLAAQLYQAPMLSPFRKYLDENLGVYNLLSWEKCMRSPKDAFIKGIINPLIHLGKRNKFAGKYFLIVLDSVDEAEPHKSSDGDTISNFIQKHCLKLPSWLKIIATARTAQLGILNLLPYKLISLGASSTEVKKDLEDYIDLRLRSHEDNSLIQQQSFKSHLVQISGGCFLHLKLVLDLIIAGQLVIKSPNFNVIPFSLSEAFLLVCNLRFSTCDSFQSVQPILSTCLAALNPLTLLEIYHSVNSLRCEKNFGWEEFLKMFKSVNGILVKRLDDTFMFFHAAFREWLLGTYGRNQKFLCNKEIGHTAIAFRYLRVEQHPLSDMKLLDLCHHLLKSKLLKEMSSESQYSQTLYPILLLNSCEDLTRALSSPTNVYSTNLKVSKLMLMAGANAKHRSESFGNSPLVTVCAKAQNVNLLLLLLEFGADINEPDEEGNTALHIASKLGDVELVTCILKKGADIVKLNARLESPLAIASQLNHARVVQAFLDVILEKEDRCSDTMKSTIHSALIRSCEAGCIDVAEVILKRFPTIILEKCSGDSPLIVSCKNSHSNMVRVLIEHGANVNARDCNGTTPLISAVLHGQHQILKLILSHDCEIDATDDKGRTALIHAARVGDLVSAQTLVNYYAKVDAKDNEGLSALCWASVRSNTRLVNFLLRCKADVRCTDKKGRSALHLASFCGNSEIVLALLEQRAAMEEADCQGNRPLDIAISGSHHDVVQIFLRHGAKLSQSTWEVALNKPNMMLILLKKLLDDGRYFAHNERWAEGEYRFQYALRKLNQIPNADSSLLQMKKDFLLEILQCKMINKQSELMPAELRDLDLETEFTGDSRFTYKDI